MGETSHLGVILLEEGQSGKELTINEGFEDFDKNLAQINVIDVTASSGGTLALTSEQTKYAALDLIGTPATALTVTIPDGEQRFIGVRNSTISPGITITLRTTTGTGITIASLQSVFIYSDGVNVDAATATVTSGIGIGNPVLSGTSGSILFVDVSGDLNQNNSNLYWDEINSRLGININTSLQSPVHINSLVSLQSTIRLDKTDEGATGSIIEMFHNTSSTANADEPGIIRFSGNVNNGLNNVTWAEIKSEVTNFTFSSEDSDLVFYIVENNILTEKFRLNADGNHTIGDISVGDLFLTQGLNAPVLNTTLSSLNLNNTHFIVNMDASGGNKIIVPPDASINLGRIYGIKKIDSTSNTVTIDPDGSDTIDGNSIKVLDTENQSIFIQSDGSNYKIIASEGFGGGGSVNISGTPANNQIALWTTSNTIEGDDTLTYDGSLLIVNGPSVVTTNPQTSGLFLGGGSGGQVALSINSPSVSHTFTSLAPADVFSQDLIANNFGTRVVRGFGESSATSGVMIQGYKVGEPVGNNAAVIIRVGTDSGSGTTALATTSNILTLQNNGTPTLHTFRADGSYLPTGDVIFQDGDTDGLDSIANGITFKKSFNLQLLVQSSNRTLNDDDYFVALDSTGGNRNANLPALSNTTQGKLYGIKKNDNSGNTVTIVRNGSDTIDNTASDITLSIAFEGRWVMADSANSDWLIVGSF